MNKDKQIWQKVSIFLLGFITGVLIQNLNFQFGPTFNLTESEKLKTIGNPNAKVQVVEYSDFQCPFCERFFSDSFLQFKKDYIDTGLVLFTFKHFPLKSIHPQATLAHQYSECAAQQGKFWEYHDKLFTVQTEWSGSPTAEDNFKQYSKELGLDQDKLANCVASEASKIVVDSELEEGIKAGVNGTPTLFVNGTPLVGAVPYNDLSSAVESALSK